MNYAVGQSREVRARCRYHFVKSGVLVYSSLGFSTCCDTNGSIGSPRAISFGIALCAGTTIQQYHSGCVMVGTVKYAECVVVQRHSGRSN